MWERFLFGSLHIYDTRKGNGLTLIIGKKNGLGPACWKTYLYLTSVSSKPPYHLKAYFWISPIVWPIVNQNQWFYHLFMITREYRRNSNIFSMAQGPCQDELQFVNDDIDMIVSHINSIIWSPHKLWGRTQVMWIKVMVFMGHQEPERIGFNIS